MTLVVRWITVLLCEIYLDIKGLFPCWTFVVYPQEHMWLSLFISMGVSSTSELTYSAVLVTPTEVN